MPQAKQQETLAKLVTKDTSDLWAMASNRHAEGFDNSGFAGVRAQIAGFRSAILFNFVEAEAFLRSMVPGDQFGCPKTERFSIDQVKELLVKLDGEAMNKFTSVVSCQQCTLGPNTIIYTPQNCYVCERALGSHAYGVRKSGWDDSEASTAMLSEVNLSKPKPSVVVEKLTMLLEASRRANHAPDGGSGAEIVSVDVCSAGL